MFGENWRKMKRNLFFILQSTKHYSGIDYIVVFNDLFSKVFNSDLHIVKVIGHALVKMAFKVTYD